MPLTMVGATLGPEDMTDLDETRRVAYIALGHVLGDVHGAGRADTMGTLVHALVHHSRLVDANEGVEILTALVGGDRGETAVRDTNVAWLREIITTLSERIDGGTVDARFD